MRILLIEDRPSSQVLYRMVLSDEGHEVIVSSSRQDAIRKVEQADPDVVVTEVLPPARRAQDTIHRIKHARPGLPVVLFSASDWRNRIQGVDAHLMKSSDTRNLVETVEQVARRSSTVPA